jgi:hypothetical protein
MTVLRKLSAASQRFEDGSVIAEALTFARMTATESVMLQWTFADSFPLLAGS